MGSGYSAYDENFLLSTLFLGGYGYVALEEVEMVILFHFRQILLDSFNMLKAKAHELKVSVDLTVVEGW